MFGASLAGYVFNIQLLAILVYLAAVPSYSQIFGVETSDPASIILASFASEESNRP